jgi:hypothetical protein
MSLHTTTPVTTLGGQRFCYSEAEVTAAYRDLIGAPRDGYQVRLSVIDGLIVRLEVARRG